MNACKRSHSAAQVIQITHAFGTTTRRLDNQPGERKTIRTKQDEQMSNLDKKEETGDAQDDAQVWEGTKANGEISRVPSHIEVKAPETQAEEIEESVKMEETATPVEDEPDQWAPATRKKGQAASVTRAEHP